MILLAFTKLAGALIALNQHQFAFGEDTTLLEKCDELVQFLQEHNASWNDASLAGATAEERLSLAACLRSRQVDGPLHELLGQFGDGEMTQLGPHQALLLTRQPSADLIARIFGFDEESDAAGEEALIGDVQKVHAKCQRSEDEDCLENGLFEVAKIFMREPMPVSDARLYGNRLAQFLVDSLAWPQQDKLVKQVNVRLDRLYSRQPVNKAAVSRLLAEYALKCKLIMADVAVEVYPILIRANYEI